VSSSSTLHQLVPLTQICGGITNEGLFSYHLGQKKFGFWHTILQNKTKHYPNFFAKWLPFCILDFGFKSQKNPKEQHGCHNKSNKF